MKQRIHLLAFTALALALPGGGALAESQYGYNTATSPQVTAQARVNLSITVPKLILLRIGDPSTQTSLTWTTGLSVSTAPTAPAVGNNQTATWDGTAPTVPAATNPAAVPVFAWTNSTGGGDLTYAATAFAAGGPALGNITVTTAGALTHPTPATLAATSTAASHFAPGSVVQADWTYSLSGSALTWTVGTYTSTITYTATSV